MAPAIEKLHSRHVRDHFSCGIASLDRFIKEFASQHQRKNFSSTYVLIENGIPNEILGFYCLSFGSIHLAELPLAKQKKLPQHPIPVARMGRLAVDERYRGKGYGGLLLQNAVKRCLAVREEIAHDAWVVDAKNEAAACFYAHFGFERCSDDKRQWYLSLGKSGRA